MRLQRVYNCFVNRIYKSFPYVFRTFAENYDFTNEAFDSFYNSRRYPLGMYL